MVVLFLLLCFHRGSVAVPTDGSGTLPTSTTINADNYYHHHHHSDRKNSSLGLFLRDHQKSKSSLHRRFPPPLPVGRYVIFRDDFNSLDLHHWTREVSMYGGFNNEFQVYTNDPYNLFTRNGYLYIKPTLTISDPRFDENFLYHGTMDMKNLFGTCTNHYNRGCHQEGDKHGLLPPVMSGKLKSKATMAFGVLEVRARIPTGDWLWPAIWLRSKEHPYGYWPRSGEIDIMESRGNQGYFGTSTVSTALHWGPDRKHRKTIGGRGKRKSWADSFHTWRLFWTPNGISVFVDDEKLLSTGVVQSFWEKGQFTGDNIYASGSKMAPFDEKFYLILNVAVGGTSGMFNNHLIKKPWSQKSPANAKQDFWDARQDWEKTWVGDKVAMIVDYVEMRSL